MKILLGCGDYETISGVPMFTYGLAEELNRRGHDVFIAAPNVGGIMAEKTARLGIAATGFDDLKKHKFDVAHASGMHASQWCVHSLPSTPVVVTTHSTLVYETPYVHDRVSEYVCVRPQIKEKIIKQDGVEENRVSVIFNGVDRARFCPSDIKWDPPRILFAGTVDYLRAEATNLILDVASQRGWEVLIVGRKLSGHVNDLPVHAKFWDGDLWNIEDVVRQCSATAGILLGRTTIEGWACGLPGFIYEIDNDGHVTDWGEYPPPPPQVMEMFDVDYMATCYERLYERIQ